MEDMIKEREGGGGGGHDMIKLDMPRKLDWETGTLLVLHSLRSVLIDVITNVYMISGL